MKKFFVILASIGMSSVAFAQTYNCDILKDSGGHAIYGGPGYSVEVEGQAVILQVSQGAHEGGQDATTEYKMEKTQQEPDGASYEAEGVTAEIFATPIQGKVVTSVSISKKIGPKTYTAECK